ncbi:hypothetical protein [Psychroserpens sp. NJDZ02]|uniref:hypothetical protein n=1 Tax=Psychroserpens sp. NJDZ02 TaxID=2570561 RepID=UPI0010A817CE|nr:hypothetical protein [Psychroserpens sp. NJDZ02]QCE42356.1 hypothetical protein E9099_13395 [Psychroserpens sp. NJDZ02]
MRDKRKKIGIEIAIVLVLFIVGVFITKAIAKNKLEDYVSNLPEHISFQYDNSDISILSGSVTIKNPSLSLKGQTTGKVNTVITMSSFAIEGFSYWNYMVNNNLAIDAIHFSDPKIKYYHNTKGNTEAEGQSIFDNLKHPLTVDQIRLDNAFLEMYNTQNDSLVAKAQKVDFLMTDFQVNTSNKANAPFQFNKSSVVIDSLYYQANDFENITLAHVAIDNNKMVLSGFKLKTKYSKEVLSKVIIAERDHFNLSIPKIEIENQKIEFQNKKPIGFTSGKVVVNNPDFNIYRDKLVADDFTSKSMYSKSLRDLGFKLQVEVVKINNGTVTYQEKVKADNAAGQLTFSNFNAALSNVNNSMLDVNKTTIDIDCVFMKNTPLNINWSFDVTDKTDQFVFKADLGALKAEDLNQFMTPNLNLKLEGDLVQTYFTIDGNAITSKVNLKTKYTQFDIILLKDNGKEKNKLLSGLINLFVSKNSKDQLDNFRNSDTKSVTRDQTKSVFNFVWKNAQAGLISAMAGDGTKDE